MNLLRVIALSCCFAAVSLAQQPAPSPTPDDYNEETRERQQEEKRGHHDEAEDDGEPRPGDRAGDEPAPGGGRGMRAARALCRRHQYLMRGSATA